MKTKVTFCVLQWCIRTQKHKHAFLEITRMKWTRPLLESQLTSTKHPADPGADPRCLCLLFLQQLLSLLKSQDILAPP